MSGFYDYLKEDPVAKIEYVKGMYDAQVHKVKQEEYVKDLLFADYVEKVKMNVSRYDYTGNLFREASEQIGNKKKKERERLTILENLIREDFFNNDCGFKITKIISGGYESYYWYIELDYCGQSVSIVIPVIDNINIRNIESAYNGMFVFSVKGSDDIWRTKKMSYKIKDIAECVKEYFKLDYKLDYTNNVNEDKMN